MPIPGADAAVHIVSSDVALGGGTTPPNTGTTSRPTAIGTGGGTVLAANSARKGATVYNEGAATLYLLLGAGASTTAYTAQVASGGYYEVPYGFTGIITGRTASGTAQPMVTELT